ncbi:large ribosomal subunit protein mL54 [Cylas formicarius]|uniref:large ribosomal subunit protein mL54 n=1 Tax=Cylas formicarius TaxID=197179 RepID=UPI002958C3EB|nr:large ribosomal subunit protein mL54 [Cylas formicarius]
MLVCKLISIPKCAIKSFTFNCPKNGYAKPAASVSMLGGSLKKKKLGKLGPTVEKRVLPVETDPEKLVNYLCGSNIYKTGEDIKLLPDSEYPEWLWNVRTGPPLQLDDLDPNSKAYWRRIRRMGIKRQNQLSKLKKF